MKRILLTTSMLVWTSAAFAQITPGQGSITDAAGNVWTITASGSIMEGNIYTPGGGGTSALIIVDGIVYGQDNGHDGNTVNPGGWFTLSTDGQVWNKSSPPAGVASTTSASSASISTGAAVTQTLPPVVDACTTAVPNYAASTGGFGTLDGQIYSPNGQPFIARGLNVDQGEMQSAMNGLLTVFPQTNFIRLNVDSYSDPSTFTAFVNYMTSHGVVVEFENHLNSDGNPYLGGGTGTIFTAAEQATESAWYASMANAFKNNPYVWYGTDNEPSDINPTTGQADQAALSAWQANTYNAIRNAGATSPIMISQWGGGVPGQIGTDGGLTAATYANMTNIIWDQHYYGWAAAEASLSSLVAENQIITSAEGKVPVIIGEYGNSTSPDGTIDPNWQSVVQQATSPSTSGANGAAVWAWDSGFSADQVLNTPNDPNSGLTPLGQMVASFIAGSGNQGCAQSPIPTTSTAPDLTAGFTATTAPALASAANSTTAPPLAANSLSINQVAAMAATP